MGWIKAGEAAAIAKAGMTGIKAGSERIAVYHSDGAYFATSDVCTHQFALLSDGEFDGTTVTCPLHQAVFDVKSGAVEEGPADLSLRTFETKVEAGAVWVRVD